MVNPKYTILLKKSEVRKFVTHFLCDRYDVFWSWSMIFWPRN